MRRWETCSPRKQHEPFFLYFATHAVHRPTVPPPRFRGKSGLGDRADMVTELDWSVGQIMETLDQLNIAKNTLLIFSSDNGAYVEHEHGHRPNGPWRGEKSEL